MIEDTLSVSSAESLLGWYRDQLGWLCRPHRDGGSADPDAEPDTEAGAETGAGPNPASNSGPAPSRALGYCREAVRLDLVLGGTRRTGALDLPALVGVAALERIGKRPAAVGPVLDGLGRLRFLVDLGEAAALDTEPVEFWYGAGIDVRLRRQGSLPLPTPGCCGPQAMVWAVPPQRGRAALPPAELLLGFLDRAVRDAYPALWEVVRRSSPLEL